MKNEQFKRKPSEKYGNSELFDITANHSRYIYFRFIRGSLYINTARGLIEMGISANINRPMSGLDGLQETNQIRMLQSFDYFDFTR